MDQSRPDVGEAETSVRFKVDAVLFDSDGVLVDSHDQVIEAWTALCRQYGLPIDEVTDGLVGVRSEDTLRRYLDEPTLRACADRRFAPIRLAWSCSCAVLRALPTRATPK